MAKCSMIKLEVYIERASIVAVVESVYNFLLLFYHNFLLKLSIVLLTIG